MAPKKPTPAKKTTPAAKKPTTKKAAPAKGRYKRVVDEVSEQEAAIRVMWEKAKNDPFNIPGFAAGRKNI